MIITAMHLNPCPNNIRRRFFDEYKHDPLMTTQVHGVVCTHAAALCEAYMPFNKSLLVLSSTRFELGRFEPARWREWVRNIQRIAARQTNVIAANNMYDVMYLQYFTGVDVLYLPPTASYVAARYLPTRAEILVGPARGHIEPVVQTATQAARAAGLNDMTFVGIRSLYARYQFSDLAAHPAVVVVPYQVSLISLIEYYAMGLPLFVPSRKLLKNWHLEQGVLTELTWDRVRQGKPAAGSPLPKHPRCTLNENFDPNNELDPNSLDFWLQFADFYQWPHIQTWSSFEELVNKLSSVDLGDVSRRMLAHHDHLSRVARQRWIGVLNRMLGSTKSPKIKIVQDDIQRALSLLYKTKLSESCTGDVTA
eukprot:TRINITY_DN1954_c0_g1_i1.p1 TRINITY_DN1954_c0_g1~~TRINITY_DN1954_c0_g1_i1.p1  ORF type:complete len:365 (+),score=43.45 TRINITY_DN1954_c0_g1_i1:541-1635(+)